MCREAGMLSIVLFQTTEVPLDRIGGFWDGAILQVVEHMGDSLEQHAPGTLQVAEDLAPFRRSCNAFSVAVFPYVQLLQEEIALGSCVDVKNLPEETSQVLGIRSPGKPPAPHQSLPLHMYQASLDDDLGPVVAQDLGHVPIAVNRGTDE